MENRVRSAGAWRERPLGSVENVRTNYEKLQKKERAKTTRKNIVKRNELGTCGAITKIRSIFAKNRNNLREGGRKEIQKNISKKPAISKNEGGWKNQNSWLKVKRLG